jgi:Domain of unknown function (DUF5666)
MLSTTHHSPWRLAQGVAKLLCVAAVLAGCGGGGGDSSADTTATAFAAGPITGFGSVIVNGVRFDDSSARISDDDGVSHNSGELKLGMMTEVDGSDVKDDALGSRHGRALAIRFGSEIVGPVTAVDTTGKTLTLIGQVVDVTTNTVFDNSISGGLAGIATGTVVEVHGVLNATNGHFTATRIEPKANALFFKVRGIVAGLDKTNKTFTIGGALISYKTLADADVPSTLADGQLVRVKVQTTQVGGAWVATRIGSGVRRVEDHEQAEIRGLITAFTSATAFSVNGIVVDATNATFPKGQAGVVLGARVEVEGKAVNGVIVATKVSTETEREDSARGFELHGSITALAADKKTFVLRGVTVSYAGTVEFRKGTEANLAVGSNVEVKGLLGSDATTLVATRISFEN